MGGRTQGHTLCGQHALRVCLWAGLLLRDQYSAQYTALRKSSTLTVKVHWQVYTSQINSCLPVATNGVAQLLWQQPANYLLPHTHLHLTQVTQSCYDSLSLSLAPRGLHAKYNMRPRPRNYSPTALTMGYNYILRPLTVTKILQQFRQYIPTASGHVKKAALAKLLAPSVQAYLLSKKTSAPQRLWWKYMQHPRCQW